MKGITININFGSQFQSNNPIKSFEIEQKLLQNLQEMWQYLGLLHLQVNISFKYWLNTCMNNLNTYKYYHNTCEYWAEGYTIGLGDMYLPSILGQPASARAIKTANGIKATINFILNQKIGDDTYSKRICIWMVKTKVRTTRIYTPKNNEWCMIFCPIKVLQMFLRYIVLWSTSRKICRSFMTIAVWYDLSFLLAPHLSPKNMKENTCKKYFYVSLNDSYIC